MDWLLRKYDDIPPTHALVEKYLPAGEVWQSHGYLFVTPELGRDMGPTNAIVTLGGTEWPAWKLTGEQPDGYQPISRFLLEPELC